MAWLALATTLLLWSAFAGRSRRPDLITLFAALAVVALSVGAVRVYPPRTEAIALLAGTVAAAVALWLAGPATGWMRWAALCAGVGAGLFSLLGPAQGLFP